MAIASCTQRHHAHYIDLRSPGWERSQRLVFPPSTDSVAWTQFHVRTSLDYPFTELAVEVSCSQGCDTLILPIEHSTDALFSHHSATLPRLYADTVRVRPIMGAELLPGVVSVGLE